MAEFTRLQTSYKIPEMLQRDIDALEEGVKNEVLYIDCLQDEVRSSAHGVVGEGLTDDQADEIINYYCRRRWI